MAGPRLPYDDLALHRLRDAPHETVTCYFARLPRARLPQRLDYGGFGHGLSFLLAGGGLLTDPQGARWPVAAGSFFRFPDGRATVMDYHGDEDFCECGVYVQPRTAALLAALGCLRDGPAVTAARDPALVLREFLALHRLLRADPGNNAVFSALAAVYVLAEQDAGPAAGGLEQARLRLGQELDRRLSLPAIAAACGLSYRVLHARFRKAYGTTPGGYRIRCRIDEAKRLLAHQSVQDTAQRLGYPDPFTFSKQFHRHVGMAPSAWREEGATPPSTLGALSAAAR